MKKLVGEYTMAGFTSIKHPNISSKLKLFLSNNSQYVGICYNLIFCPCSKTFNRAYKAKIVIEPIKISGQIPKYTGIRIFLTLGQLLGSFLMLSRNIFYERQEWDGRGSLLPDL